MLSFPRTVAREATVRDGLLCVALDDGSVCCTALAPYELAPDALRALVGREGATNWSLQVLVDFDRRAYVRSLIETNLHAYVPPDW